MKFIFIRNILFFLFLLASTTFFSQTQYKKPQFLKIGTKYYVMDTDGEQYFPDSFDGVYGSFLCNYSDTLKNLESFHILSRAHFIVKRNNKFGVLINRTEDFMGTPKLEYLIPCEYDFIQINKSDMFGKSIYYIAQSKKKYGIFDFKGKQLGDFKYDKIEDLHLYHNACALFRVKTENKYEILLKDKNDQLIPFINKKADSIYCNSAFFLFKDKTGSQLCKVEEKNYEELTYSCLPAGKKNYYFLDDWEFGGTDLIDYNRSTLMANFYDPNSLTINETRKLTSDEKKELVPFKDAEDLNLDEFSNELFFAVFDINKDSLKTVYEKKLKNPTEKDIDDAIRNRIEVNEPMKLNPTTYQYNWSELGYGISREVKIITQGNLKGASISDKYDKKNKPIEIPQQYEDLEFDSKGNRSFIKSLKDKKSGIIDLNGIVLLNNEWEKIRFIDKIPSVFIAEKKDQSTLFQYNYKTNKLDTLFSSPSSFNAQYEFYSLVITNEKQKLIAISNVNYISASNKSKYIIPNEYDSIKKLETINQCYFTYKSGKIGFQHRDFFDFPARFDSMQIHYLFKTSKELVSKNYLLNSYNLTPAILAFVNDSIYYYKLTAQTFEKNSRFKRHGKNLKLSLDGSFFIHANAADEYEIFNTNGRALRKNSYKNVAVHSLSLDSSSSGNRYIKATKNDGSPVLIFFDGTEIVAPSR